MSLQLSKKELLIIFLTTFLSSLGSFCTDSNLPSFPAIVQAFNSSAEMIKWSISLYFLGFAFSQLFYGPFADWAGRRKVILFGIALAILGNIICVIAFNIQDILIGRLIQGLGLGVTNSIYRALVRDTFSGTRMAKVQSYMGTIYCAVIAVAPVMGGYIQDYFGWRANFFSQLLILMAALITFILVLPETLKEENRSQLDIRKITQSYIKLIKEPVFLVFTLCSGLANAGLVAYITESPFLYQTILGLTPVQYGWLAISMTLALLVGALLNTIVVDYLYYQKVIWLGNGIMLISSIVLLFTGLLHILNVWVLVIPCMLYILGGGFVFTNASTSALSPFPKVAGIAGGLYGCLQILCGFVFSGLMARLNSTNQITLALVFMGISILSMLLLLIVKKA
jgi:Bcr/CflA subfamily drug resistance transporter